MYTHERMLFLSNKLFYVQIRSTRCSNLGHDHPPPRRTKKRREIIIEKSRRTNNYQLKSTYCQQKVAPRAAPHDQAVGVVGRSVVMVVGCVVAVAAVVAVSTLLIHTICAACKRARDRGCDARVCVSVLRVGV